MCSHRDGSGHLEISLISSPKHDNKPSIGTGDMTATVLLGAIDRLLKDDFHLVPKFLSMCSAGWEWTDYGELHAGGTSGNRK